MARQPTIRIKRVYDPPAPEDGTRVLVDGLWPRGLAKARAGVDLWLREVAPSAALRRWYGHRPERWEAFCERYAAELAAAPEALDRLAALAEAEPVVTLVFAARDTERSNAAALKRILESRPARRRR